MWQMWSQLFLCSKGWLLVRKANDLERELGKDSPDVYGLPMSGMLGRICRSN